MRIYNGKRSTLTIPLVGSNQKISVAPKSVSGDFMPNKELLSLIMTTFDYNEIALIVSGPFEISMCSQVSGCVGFVVYSLEEAIERFSPKQSTPKPVESNPAVLEDKPVTEPEVEANPEAETVVTVTETQSEPEEGSSEVPVEVVPEAETPKPARKYRKKKSEE